MVINSYATAASLGPLNGPSNAEKENADADLGANPQGKSRICLIPYVAWANYILPSLKINDLCSLRLSCRKFKGTATHLKGGTEANNYQDLIRKEFAHRIYIKGEKRSIVLPTPLDSDACVSLRDLLQRIELQVFNLCRSLESLPDAIQAKIARAYKARHDLVEPKDGQFNQFIRGLELEEDDISKIENLRLDILRTDDFIIQNIYFSLIFGSKWLENREKELLEPLGLAAEDVNYSARIHQALNEKRDHTFSEGCKAPDSRVLLENMRSSAMKIFQRISSWMEKYMGPELLPQSKKDFSAYLMRSIDGWSKDLLDMTPEENCLNYLGFKPQIWGLLFITDLYTREQIQKLVSHVLNDEAKEAQQRSFIESENSFNNPHFIRIAVLSQHPDKTEIVLRYLTHQNIDAQTIRVIVESRPLSDRVIVESRPLSEKIVVQLLESLTFDFLDRFMGYQVSHHDEVVSELFKGFKFDLNKRCRGYKRNYQMFFSEGFGIEERSNFIEQLLEKYQKEIMKNSNQLSVESVSHLLVGLSDDSSFPRLKNEDKTCFATQFLEQYQEALPISLLSKLLSCSSNPCIQKAVRKVLSCRGPASVQSEDPLSRKIVTQWIARLTWDLLEPSRENSSLSAGFGTEDRSRFIKQVLKKYKKTIIEKSKNLSVDSVSNLLMDLKDKGRFSQLRADRISFAMELLRLHQEVLPDRLLTDMILNFKDPKMQKVLTALLDSRRAQARAQLEDSLRAEIDAVKSIRGSAKLTQQD